MAKNTDMLPETALRLEAQAARGLLRSLTAVESCCGPTVTVGGRQVVCLCSNDYLCLAADERVRAAARGAIDAWGVGAGASRLISGTTVLHRQLERELAELKGAEAALVTSTGWMANHVAVHTLAGKGDLVLCDKLSHASLLDAARSSGAVVRTYPHCDTGRLAAMLDRHRSRYRRCLIATDSLFSMDGDVAPLGELADLKDRYDARLLIDEAHATGVMGERGAGAAEMLGVEGRIDAAVGTLSKAVGALGGFVAGPKVLIDTIVNFGRAFIYTTALPATLCAAALESLRIIRAEPERRRRLGRLADELRSRLAAAGWQTGRSCSQIIPIVVGESSAALRLSARLLDEGFWTPAIRPPTVARRASRLRVSLCCDHEQDELSRFADALGRGGGA
ncbi:MAG TPA: 8-amino-7-oxononanoate synthase [Phycisphaerae bacterium]|nr:8-amino-7-oxononanoate synthase [Phycisphaerae bacterium]HUT61986.1 8-amino-7-oxononanoate synthase [Phycisphaerae bacterium]